MSAQEPAKAVLSAKSQQAIEKLRTNTLYENVQLVQMGSMDKVQQKGQFVFSLPGASKRFGVQMTNVRATSEKDYVWMGELADSLGSMTLVAEKGNIRGHFAIGGDQYEIFPVEGRTHALVKVNMKQLSNKSCRQPEKPDKVEPAPVKPTPKGGRLETCYSQPDQVVRVLVCFTANALAEDPNVVQTAQLAIAQTNQAFYNSGINGSVVAADIRQLDIPGESNSTADNLAAFIARLNAENLLANTGADVAMLITRNYVGEVPIGQANAGDFLASNNTFAQAVVGVGVATNLFTFSHELGHLFGARHQQCFNLPQGGACDDTPGYNHGYVFVGGGTHFEWLPLPVLIFEPDRPRGTVMVNPTNAFYFDGFWRDSDVYAPILSYSNPGRRVVNAATGTDQNNNARWIGERFGAVANYRQFPLLSSNIDGPTYLNPSSTYTWEAVYRCGAGPYSFQWAISTNGFNYYQVGTGETYTSGAGFLYAGNPSYLRLTVTSADNQTSFSYLRLDRNSSSGWRAGSEVVADKPTLQDAYPNPTTGETVIDYSLPKLAAVRLDVVSQTGHTVAVLTEGEQEAGKYTQVFDGSWLPAGLYLYRLRVNGEMTTKRIVLSR